MYNYFKFIYVLIEKSCIFANKFYCVENKVIQLTISEYDSSTEELPKSYFSLIEAASLSAKKAYAPYSNFSVGAALLLDNGEIISGNNQENAAYPSGICAERVAVFFANSQFPHNKILALAIVAFQNNNIMTTIPVPPCGSCRQVILESQLRQKEPIKLILGSSEKIYVIDDASLLLPIHFNKEMIL